MRSAGEHWHPLRQHRTHFTAVLHLARLGKSLGCPPQWASICATWRCGESIADVRRWRTGVGKSGACHTGAYPHEPRQLSHSVKSTLTSLDRAFKLVVDEPPHRPRKRSRISLCT